MQNGFFAHCFAFHDYNIKLPTYTFYGKKFHYVIVPFAFREILPRLEVRSWTYVRTITKFSYPWCFAVLACKSSANTQFFFFDFLVSAVVVHGYTSTLEALLSHKPILDMRRFRWETDNLMEDARQKLRKIGDFKSLFQSQVECQAMIFYCHQNKLIFARKVLHLASF